MERPISDIGKAIATGQQFLTPCSSCELDPVDCRRQYEGPQDGISPVLCDLYEMPITMEVADVDAVQTGIGNNYSRAWK